MTLSCLSTTPAADQHCRLFSRRMAELHLLRLQGPGSELCTYTRRPSPAPRKRASEGYGRARFTRPLRPLTLDTALGLMHVRGGVSLWVEESTTQSHTQGHTGEEVSVHLL